MKIIANSADLWICWIAGNCWHNTSQTDSQGMEDIEGMSAKPEK